MSTGDHGLPGKLEDVLGREDRYLMHTKYLLNSYNHSYQILPPSNKGDRMPVGEDGGFGEETELKHYVIAEGEMESGATKSFEKYVESSYAGLSNATRGRNKITGGTKG